MQPVWIWRSQAQDSYHVNSRVITPIVRSAGVHMPNRRAFVGLLWQFPEAVEVEDQATGAHTRLPIPDPTRMIVWFLMVLAMVMVIAMALMRRRVHAPR